MHRLLAAALLALALFAAAPLAHGADLAVVSDYHPPYNYEKDGTVQGFCAEVVREIMRRTGHEEPIQAMDWEEAYERVQFLPGHAFFSMFRTPRRDIIFKWVGPLISDDVVVFKKRSRKDVTARHMGQAARFKIGALVGYPGEYLLREYQMPHVEMDADPRSNLLKLMDGSIDLWVSGRRSALAITRFAGLDAVTIEECFKLDTFDLCVAFSASTSDDIVNAWQDALDAMKADGTYDALVAKHFPK